MTHLADGRRRRGRRRRGAGPRPCSARSSTAWTAGRGRREATSPRPSSSSSRRTRPRTAAPTDALAAASARLGDIGVALQKDLIRAGGSMQVGRGEPGQDRGRAGGRDQSSALEAPDQVARRLARSVERLLVELRTELQSRLIAELTEMHEIQAAIRETTQAQAPRVAQKSRTALIAGRRPVAEGGGARRPDRAPARPGRGDRVRHRPADGASRLAPRDAEDPGMAQGRATLAPHRRPGEARRGRPARPARGDPPASAHDPAAAGSPLPTDPRARERELNRLIAELKMIRLLQFRLNDDTVEVDHGHAQRRRP